VPLLVYALAHHSLSRRRLRGIDREPLHSVTVGKVTAVVGSVRQRPAATPESLRRYDVVVRAIASGTSAILPARFATIMSGLSEIEDVLGARQPYFTRALRHVRGRAQMTVRVIGRTPAADTSAGSGRSRVASNDDEIHRRQRDGAGYLRQRAAEAARARRVPGFDRTRAAVEQFVRDERVETRGAVATVYHLIPRASAPAYCRALEAAARRDGLRVVVSGPWPPYAFAET